MQPGTCASRNSWIWIYFYNKVIADRRITDTVQRKSAFYNFSIYVNSYLDESFAWYSTYAAIFVINSNLPMNMIDVCSATQISKY